MLALMLLAYPLLSPASAAWDAFPAAAGAGARAEPFLVKVWTWNGLRADLDLVERSRAASREALAVARAHPEVFPEERRPRDEGLLQGYRELALSLWKNVLDLTLGFDAIVARYGDFDAFRDEDRRQAAFLAAFGASAAQQRLAEEWLRVCGADAPLAAALNEAVPELGLPAGSLTRMKSFFQSRERACALAAAASYAGKVRPAKSLEAALGAGGAARFSAELAEEVRALGLGAGAAASRPPRLEAWTPLKSGVSYWDGDPGEPAPWEFWFLPKASARRRAAVLISQEQIRELAPYLRPGDVLLTRREWFLEQLGLPGFWTHASLYMGTPEQRARLFGRERGEPAGTPEVLDAAGSIVAPASLGRAAAADALAVLRPRLSKAGLIAALRPALSMAGPSTSAGLVYKIYAGLKLPAASYLGRDAASANELVRSFDADFGAPSQQFDFVLFVDSKEGFKRAGTSTLEDFRASWRRPKWRFQAGRQQSIAKGENP